MAATTFGGGRRPFSLAAGAIGPAVLRPPAVVAGEFRPRLRWLRSWRARLGLAERGDVTSTIRHAPAGLGRLAHGLAIRWCDVEGSDRLPQAQHSGIPAGSARR